MGNCEDSEANCENSEANFENSEMNYETNITHSEVNDEPFGINSDTISVNIDNSHCIIISEDADMSNETICQTDAISFEPVSSSWSKFSEKPDWKSEIDSVLNLKGKVYEC